MKRRRNRSLTRHRLVLAGVALLLISVGVLGLLLATGTVGRLTDWAVSEGPLLNRNVDEALRAGQTSYLAGAVALGVVLFALGAIWLRAQVPARRHHQDQEFANDVPSQVGPSDTDPSDTGCEARVAGSNVVRGGALAEALEEDLQRHPRVDRAVVEFRSDEGVLRLRLTTADALALSTLHSEVIRPAVERVAIVGEFAETPEVEADVRFADLGRVVA